MEQYPFTFVSFSKLGQMSLMSEERAELFTQGKMSLSCNIRFSLTNNLRLSINLALEDVAFVYQDNCSFSLRMQFP